MLHLWSFDSSQECQDNSMRKELSFQEMVLEQLEDIKWKIIGWTPVYTVYKILLKMNPKYV